MKTNSNEPYTATDPQAILERADVGIVHLDRNFRLAYVNARAAEILEDSKENLIGRVLRDVVPEDICREISHELKRCLKEKVPVSFETACPEPEQRWFGCSCTLSEQGYTLVIQDITERKQAEKRLKESENRYHSLFENNHAVMLLINPDTGRIVDANPAAAAYYGYSREQLTSMNIMEISTLTREQVLQEMKQVQSQQQYVFLFRHRLANGEVREVEVYSGPIVVSGETLLYSIIHDITERRQAENAVRASEEKYRSLFESSIDGILLTAPDGRIFAANPAACRILQKTEEEIIRAGRDALLDTSDPKLKPLLEERKHSGRARGELTFRRKDGTAFPADVSSSVITDKEGHIRSSVFFRDITELKNAQDILRRMNEELERKVAERTGNLEQTSRLMEEQKELLQAIVDRIPVIVTLWSPSGKLGLVNREFERITGWSADEALNTDILAAVFPDPAYRKDVIRRVEKTDPGWGEFEILTRSGGTLIISWAAVSLSDGSRVGIGIDITRRKKMENDLLRLAAAVEQTGEGIALSSPDGVIEYVNSAYENITGYSRDELIGRNFGSFREYLAGNDIQEILDQVVKEGKVWSGRQIRKRKTGEIIVADVTKSPVRDEAGKIINTVAVIKNVTQEVRLQDQLAQNQKLEAIGTLAGGIAHDLKNILTPIVTDTEIALMDIEEDHPVRELLGEIMQAARMGTDLVSRVVTFGRGVEQEKKPVAIEPVVKEAVDFLRSALPSTIEIHQQLSGGGAVVMADPMRIKQVMINLGTNAGYAMRERGGELDVRLIREDLGEEEAWRLSPDLKAGLYVRIMVRDTGEGMDEQTIQHIFEPFFTTKKQGEGTGMGLSVVHGIVKEHNGAVTVWSKPGRGSTFSVLLPVLKEGKHAGDR